MKKVVVLVVLLLPIIAMAAVLPYEAIPLTQPVEVGVMQGLAFPNDTIPLMYDEGIMGTGYGLDAGERIGVKFTPPSYPFELLAVGYAAVNWSDRVNDWNAACDIVIFGDGERPGEETGRLTNAQAEDSSVVNFFDATPLAITVNSGSFYCAVENITDIDPSVGIDVGSPVHRVGWMYTDVGDGTQWYHFSELISEDYPGMTLADTLDVIIRAIGVVAGGIVELEPDVVEFTPSATIVASGATINYTLTEPGAVEITLWDALGRKVGTLYEGHAEAGENVITWDSTLLPRGTYFIYLKTASALKTARVVLVE